MAGDGSIEWVMEPIQASVLLDIADALGENAKLREEIEAAKHDLSMFSERIVELDAKNAKLRELVKNMYYDLTNMTFPPDWVTEYEADMRELGIEVTS